MRSGSLEVPPTSSTDQATTRLAAFALATHDLDEALAERLRQCFVDFIGLAAFAADRIDESSKFRVFSELGFSGGGGTVIGQAETLAFPHAALLNGAHAHSLDFDDTNVAGGLHPGAPVIAASLAQAERSGASGQRLLEAIAVGYEVACRVGAALTTASIDRGFHLTPVAGIFGATAAVARLGRLDPPTCASAFGLAGSRASGSMQYLANGGWNKRLHPGFAAHDALIVTAMAQAGVVGATEPIEGRYGVLHAFTGKGEPGALLDGLGSRWVAASTAIKPYPSCRLTHGAIDAALELRDAAQPMLGKGAIKITLSPTARTVVGIPEANKIEPGNLVEAQFSVYFQVASALFYGNVDLPAYERVGAPTINDLSRRISVEVDATLPLAGAMLEIAAPGHTTLMKRIEAPRGEPEAPLSWGDVLEKFDGLAAPVFGAGRARVIAAKAKVIDQLDDVRTFIAALRL
jgi:2-methylcitrate dehydratase PrpD